MPNDEDHAGSIFAVFVLELKIEAKRSNIKMNLMIHLHTSEDKDGLPPVSPFSHQHRIPPCQAAPGWSTHCSACFALQRSGAQSVMRPAQIARLCRKSWSLKPLLLPYGLQVWHACLYCFLTLILWNCKVTQTRCVLVHLAQACKSIAHHVNLRVGVVDSVYISKPF